MIVLGLATLVPRVLLAHYLAVYGTPERWEYDVIATNIANGEGHIYDRRGFVYAAYAPPLWSYILAALHSLPGNTGLSIQVVQAILCLGSALTCAGLARRMAGDDRVGWIAGLMVALQPSLLYYSVVKSDPLALTLFLLGLIAVSATTLAAQPGDRRAVTFGILTGLGVLARGTPGVALPVVLTALLIRWRLRGLRPIAIAALAFALTLAPWLARNLAVLGAPLVTSTTGENFWRGNHEGAGGNVLDLDGGEITRIVPTNPALPEAIRVVLANGTEVERHRVFGAEAWRFIASHPGAALELFARKMRTFWWRIESDPADYSPLISAAYEVIYRAELALALIGMFFVFRPPGTAAPAPDRMAAGMAVALMIAISVLQSAFYVQGRHRFLIEPLLLIFTACGLLGAVRMGTGRGGWPSEGPGVVRFPRKMRSEQLSLNSRRGR